jgi:D-sedoheptulose 7-phosphate isomerase
MNSEVSEYLATMEKIRRDHGKSLIKNWIRESIRLKEDLWGADWMQGQIFDVAETLVEAFRNGKKVMFCGSGGSAADSAHAAAEFLNRLSTKRTDPLPAIDLTAMSSTITAIANDYSFDEVFEKQLRALGKAGDVLIGISTSGKSKNVLLALWKAKALGIKTVLLTGKHKDKYVVDAGMAPCGANTHEFETVVEPDYVINLHSDKTSILQESHIMLLHILVYLVDYYMYGVDYLED